MNAQPFSVGGCRDRLTPGRPRKKKKDNSQDNCPRPLCRHGRHLENTAGALQRDETVAGW